MEFFFQFVLPALIVTAIAALLAFVLSFLGEKLKDRRDPKIDDVARQLCGANCGGCGYAGCDAFAVALVEGKAKVDDCKPTSNIAKKNISAILGQAHEESRPTRAIVHCNGGNKCKDKYEYQGYGDCRSAEMLGGGAKACSFACLGLGTCVSACGFDAITVDKDSGVAVVDAGLCTSCGACVSACPKKIISRIPVDAAIYIACSNTNRGREVAAVCEVGCIACGKCTRTCPTGAISLDNNLAVVDYTKCISCLKCVEACPRKCIHSLVAAQPK